MEPYQQRVVYEKTDLDIKIFKLRPFIGSERFLSLEIAEQERMTRQFNLMEQYSEVLGFRIANFKQ